jgi:hypothetical protein
MATTDRPQRTPFLSAGMPVVLAMSAALLILHCYLNSRYDFFRDEFNYLACARHLAWGYVDQPPLIPWLVRLSLATLGDSLRALAKVPSVDPFAVSSMLQEGVAMLQKALEAPAKGIPCQDTSLALDPELMSDFIVESREHLVNIESQVLTLEREPSDTEALNAVFRGFHTIKGLAGFLLRGFFADRIVVVVAVFDRVIENRRIRGESGDRKLIDIFFEAAAIQQCARDVVEPDALATVMQDLCWFHTPPFFRALVMIS